MATIQVVAIRVAAAKVTEEMMSDQGPSGVGPRSGGGGGSSGGASDAKEQAKETATAAVAKTGEVAGTATEGARQVASEATRQAGELTKEAAAQVRSLASEATGQLREQAGQQTQRAASGLRSLSEQVRALSDGRPEEAGAAGDYVRQAGDKLQDVAQRLDEGGLDGLFEDLQGFARRRPGLFLIGAAAAGFAAGRVLRGAQAAGSDDGGQQGTTPGEPALRLGRADGPLTTGGMSPAPASTAPVGGGVPTGMSDVGGTVLPPEAPPPRSGGR
jgi:hypothetical protein